MYGDLLPDSTIPPHGFFADDTRFVSRWRLTMTIMRERPCGAGSSTAIAPARSPATSWKTLYSGWGVRTMATTEGGYNPVEYRNGTV